MTPAFVLQTGHATAQPRAAVVGGSLGGLAAAHALSQSGWKVVDVMERSPGELRNKGSGLGFVHIPSWESLTHRPMMRRQRRASRAQGSYYYGDLWGYLYDGLDPKNVNVQFGKAVTEIGGSVNSPVIDEEEYDLVVLADGGFSSLRRHVFNDETTISQPEPEYAGYVVWRGSVLSSKLPATLLRDIRYLEGVYKDGKYDTIALKMAKDNGEDVWMFGTFVETHETDLASYGWNKDKDGKARHHGGNRSYHIPEWFLPHMKAHFGDVPGLVPLVEHIIEQGELQPHPQFEFGNINKVHNGRILILGDAAHMASPRTAVGAHTAIQDALALRGAFARVEDDVSLKYEIDKALQQYSQDGLAHANQLYARTRAVSREFVEN